jgi:Clr5 domain
MGSLETLQGEIFLHYITENRTLVDVMRIMEEKHGVCYS